ncbi:MAG: hypothetical protein ACD_76C00113G0001 [uncultured bacterium]|nr:MAG: hypothetical protein ACD_76C00113G0001 [uncultured bacterium]
MLLPLGGYFDHANVKTRLNELELQMSAQGFWNDQERGKKISQEAGELRIELGVWDSFEKRVKDAIDLAQMAYSEKDNALAEDILKQHNELKREFEKLEFQTLFGGEHDKANAVVAIHSGSGGTEAQDWAEMLLRMVTRFCENKGFSIQILSESRGGEAGIKSAMFRVQGRYAYGYLRSEAGVHRLVRISPFDAEKMRHTSFALIEVLPELEDIKDIEIDPKDLRIDTFMSSGKGGQSVNTTYSAVRVVHIPTNITVSCQNERSQLQNKETAIKVLKSKLHKMKLEELDAEKKKLRGEYQSAEWGNQIRSYVLHPYQMVKDHRTEAETADSQAVLNGEIDMFIEAFLKWERGK